MTQKKFKQLGLIGCGMMGGSFALAAKRAGLVERVVGYSKSPSNSESAKQLGAIDQVAASALQATMGSDLVLISVPVSATADVMKAIQFGYNKDALVMDVGSTKQHMIEVVTKIFGYFPSNFVPAHPVAGKERAGISEADVDLYHGHRVILTPTEQTKDFYLARAKYVWKSLGMKVSQMSAQSHDSIYAATSHFPHLLAFAYVVSIAGQDNKDQLLSLAGPGFRDFTRIAAGDPEMWRDILMTNRDQVLKQSSDFLASLSRFDALLRESDAKNLEQLIQQSSQTRLGWTMNATSTEDDV